MKENLQIVVRRVALVVLLTSCLATAAFALNAPVHAAFERCCFLVGGCMPELPCAGDEECENSFCCTDCGG